MNRLKLHGSANRVESGTVRLFDAEAPGRPATRPRLRTVIFATDLSVTSRLGLDWAAWLAGRDGAKLWIVHADQPLDRGEGHLHTAARRTKDRQRERLLALVPSDRSVECEHRLLIGDPAREIVRLALREQADLIVLGTHGRTGLRRLLAGSVAEEVLRRAPCPVFVFPQT
jgi:nucleotide-binding universal stress UspA family protein